MAVKIRLQRKGRKKLPYYAIVVANSRAPRDGAFIEILGKYNPLLPKEDANRISMKMDRVEHWLKMGALPTKVVERFIKISK